MALINCPECGKEISDKAAACPHCGYPITTQQTQVKPEEDDKEYVFCPKCMSTHVHTEQKGFSGGKALAGAVTFGGLGLLAGTIGSKNVLITCLKCGHKFKAGDAFISTHKQKDEILKSMEELLVSNKRLDAVKLLNEKLDWKVGQSSQFIDSYLKGHKDLTKKIEDNSPATPKGCLAASIIIILIGLLFIYGFCNGELTSGFWVCSIIWLSIASLIAYTGYKGEKEKQDRQRKDADNEELEA